MSPAIADSTGALETREAQDWTILAFVGTCPRRAAAEHRDFLARLQPAPPDAADAQRPR
jgi:hypothetical protein